MFYFKAMYCTDLSLFCQKQLFQFFCWNKMPFKLKLAEDERIKVAVIYLNTAAGLKDREGSEYKETC